MFSRLALLVLWYLLLSYSGSVRAQQVTFNRVPPPSGFHSGSKAGVQDPQGYMWIGTYQSPLRRYDGYNYVSYNHDPLNPNSLALNWVESLWAGRNGFMWIGTEGQGLDRLELATGKFIHYKYNPKDSNSLSNNNVGAILEDREGMLWIGTQKGLNRLDPKTGKFQRYFHKPNDPSSLSCNRVAKIYEDQQGTIWVGTGSVWREEGGETDEGGLNRFDKKTGKFTRYLHEPANPHSLINNKVKAIFEDSRGTFWVGTAGDGLHTMDRGKGIFERHLYDPTHPEKLSRPPQKKIRPHADDHITFIIEDATGVIWIGTFGNGLNRYDPKTKKAMHFPGFKDPVTGMKLEIPWWACSSQDGILWIGYFRGLYRIDPFQRNIPYYATGTPINNIYEDKFGILWYGSDEGLVQKDRIIGIERRYVNEPGNPHSISNNGIGAIFEDRQGLLWIGTGSGLIHFDRKTGKFVRNNFNQRVDSILNRVGVSSIYEDRRGFFWIGNGLGGVMLINRKANTFRRFSHNPKDPNSLSQGWVYHTLEDRSGNLWIGTAGGGLNRFIPQTGRFQRFFPGTNIHSLRQDFNGILWVGTSTGLYRSNPTLSSFSRFNGPNGEFAEGIIVNGILEDNQKNLWLNASLGICRINPGRHEVVIFNRYEDPIWYNGTGSFKSKNGELFFGGGSGYFAFFPEQLTRNTKPPQIVITNFRLADKPVVPGKESPLKKPLWQTKEIWLRHNQNVFSFDFAGIHYSSPEENRHLFMLEGLYNTWRKAGKEKTAYFYSVPPGRYVFRIKASNSDGVWAEKAIAIIISPPWWRTWWAYSLFGLALSTFIFSFIRFRLRQEREQQAIERERWEAEQLRTVDEIKTRFFSNITHEFRTPLSLILPPTEQLLQEVKEPQHQQRLSLIRRHAQQLLGLINQLLDLSKLEAGNMTATDSRGDLAAFVGQLVDNFRPLAEEKGITLQYECKIEEAEYFFDADKWSKILNNLLSNALKFTPSSGRVAVKLSWQSKTTGLPQKQEQAILMVEDTGIGIAAAKQEHIFDRFYQVDNSQTRTYEGTGIGLSLVKELVDLLQGKIMVNTQPGAGTTFTVSLPISKAAMKDYTPLAQVPFPIASLPILESSTNNLPEYQNHLYSNPEASLVLVVEDNADLRDFIASELASTYRVVTAVNGQEGWQLVQQELPEVVISDVMMPVMDGYALTERIKTNLTTNHIAVILLTAKAAQESKVAGLEQGADDYLTKPFHLPELKLRLRNLLDHQQKIRQYYQQHLSLPQQGVSPIETVQDKFLQTLYQVLEEQLDNSELQVDTLAEALAMSRRTLYRKLAAITGLSPNEIIKNYRLQRATQFLLAGHSVSETAYLVGFESPTTFGQLFKKQYQKSPSEYQQQHLA